MKIEIDFDQIVSKACHGVRGVFNSVNILHILLLSLVLHALVMSIPDGFIFDEAHYVPAAIKTMNLEPANAEHTPLAKIMMGVSIQIFGNYWFAWRAPMVICSLLSTYLLYLIARKYFGERMSLVAASFLLFDTMFFVNGSIAILDVPAVTFGLLGIYLYLDKKYGWSGLALAVSFLMKELGLLLLGAVIVHALITKARKYNLVKGNIKKVFGFVLILFAVSFFGLWTYDAIYKPSMSSSVIVNAIVIVDQNGVPLTTTYSNSTIQKPITNPVEHMEFSWGYFSGLAPNVVTPDSEYRPPWSWILPIGDNIFNPPVYSGVSVTAGGVTKNTVRWVSQPSPFVEYFTLPILIAAIALMLKKKDEGIGVLLFSWIVVTVVPWLVFGAFMQRMSINYYIIYGIPAMALGIPFFWSVIPMKEKHRNAIICIHLLATVLFFLYYYPIIFVRT